MLEIDDADLDAFEALFPGLDIPRDYVRRGLETLLAQRLQRLMDSKTISEMWCITKTFGMDLTEDNAEKAALALAKLDELRTASSKAVAYVMTEAELATTDRRTPILLFPSALEDAIGKYLYAAPLRLPNA